MAARALLVALSLVASLPASAGMIRISDDLGGLLPDYAYRFSRMAMDGDSVVISGRCASACTLALIYVPRDKLCAMPGAKFQFHQTSGPEGGPWLRRNYPPALVRWIDARGGLTAKVLTLEGPELRQFVRPCDVMVAGR
jgi:hypothetical protein